MQKSCIILATAERSVRQKSQTFFRFVFTFHEIGKFEFLSSSNRCFGFWISDVRYHPDPEAPLAVVLRREPTTKGAGNILPQSTG